MPASSCRGAADFNALAYVLNGSRHGRRPTTGRCTPASSRCSAPVTTSPSRPTRRRTVTRPALDVIVVGGQPIREPVAWHGPFVMNTQDEVIRRYEDYQKGRFGHIPA